MRSRLVSFAVNGARILTGGWPIVPRQHSWNRCGADEALRVWRWIAKGKPKTIVDVGARSSEFCGWLWKRFPEAKLISFEPDHSVTPLGEVYRLALSNVSGRCGWMDTSRICPELVIGEGPIKVRRFDTLDIEVERPAILKVDAESSTLPALQGFGGRLREFDLVVVEVINGQHQPIADLMREHGFCRQTITDFGHIGGRLLSYDVAFTRG